MSKPIHWAIGMAVVLAMTGTAVAEDAIEIVDQTGVTVRISQPVERLISVYGSGTFTVYALGASKSLVMAWYIGVKGIAQASEAMYRLEPRLAELLAFGDPNVEEIVARNAQLLLVDGSRHSAFAEQMAELGIPVVRLVVETPDELKEAVSLIGRVLGPEALARATAFLEDYERLFSSVASDLQDITQDDRVRVLFLGTDPLRVASGNMYQRHLIEAAGGISVSQQLAGYWNDVNFEQILLWDPDVILIPPYGPVQPADLLGNTDWSSIRAVQDGRVHRMPRVIAPMDAPVPESLLGVVWMASVFYPDLIRVDLAAEVARFYAFYYGYALSEAELEYLTGR